MTKVDAGEVNAWQVGSPPLTPDAAERLLVSGEPVPRGNNTMIRLMIVRLSDDRVLAGGVIGDTLVFDITRDDWERMTC